MTTELLRLQYVQRELSACIIVWQRLHIVYHLSVTFSPFWIFDTEKNQNASTSDQKLPGASAMSQTHFVLLHHLWIPLLLLYKRVVVTGVPTAQLYCSWTKKKNKTTLFARKASRLKPSNVRADTETLLSPQYPKSDDTILIPNRDSLQFKRKIYKTSRGVFKRSHGPSL